MTSTHALPRLYTDLAELWPLLSPPADYAGDAAILLERLDAHFAAAAASVTATRRTLLELGVGGGHALHHLAPHFVCTAVDLSEPMLSHCRRLNPDVETVVGDMRTLRLGRTFDAVLVHDAIDYMLDEAEARATVETVAAHLSPGGIALVAPTYTRESFVEGDADGDQQHDPQRGLTLTYRTRVHDPDPADTTFELRLTMTIRRGGRVEHVEDRHRCGLFSEAQWLAMLGEAGLDGRVIEARDAAWTLFSATRRVQRAIGVR